MQTINAIERQRDLIAVRLLACVRACQGFSLDALKRGTLRKLVEEVRMQGGGYAALEERGRYCFCGSSDRHSPGCTALSDLLVAVEEGP